MPTNPLNESAIEYLLLEHLATLGYQCKSGKDLGRKSNEWMLENVFRESVCKINFETPNALQSLNLNQEIREKLLDEAVLKLKALENIELLEANAKWAYLVNGMSLLRAKRGAFSYA